MKNATVEYINMMGDLYLYKGTHLTIAIKKIHHFKDYLRTRLYNPLSGDIEDQIKVVIQKTGISENIVQPLFLQMNAILSAEEIDKNELLNLNKRIENFKRKLES